MHSLAYRMNERSTQAASISMRSAVERILSPIAAPVVAVSGGADSVTLAALAVELLPDVEVVHAVSPAVGVQATTRVIRLAEHRGWSLTIVDAGEFTDPRYRSNPVDRCFYCKTNLYGTIRSHTDSQILSGANTDDLREFRSGLAAARRYAVRHPYIEAGIDKHGVRRIARELGLDEVAALPASPCLSSRIETGIRIESATLGFIQNVEQIVAARLKPQTVRCRIRAAAITIELDARTLSNLEEEEEQILIGLIAAEPRRPRGLPIVFDRYRSGSAFLVKEAVA
jgi:pyridinium-3,5-biscarboxylic acid mononucleotide sulfurtransferase